MEGDATTLFDVLIWSGAALTLAGLAMLVWCILRVARARRNARDDAELRASIQKIVPLNLAALFLSMTGLMLVVIGVILS